MDTAKIAYIGDETTSLLFKSIGVNSFCFRRGEAKEKFENLVNSGEYAIIFISEDFYLELAEMIKKFLSRTTPTILLLPSLSGSKGYALEFVREMMKKAAGSDIMDKG